MIHHEPIPDMDNITTKLENCQLVSPVIPLCNPLGRTSRFIAKGQFSQVYTDGQWAFKMIEITSVKRFESLRLALRETLWLYLFRLFPSPHVIHSIHSQCIVEQQKIVKIIHQLPIAHATLSDWIRAPQWITRKEWITIWQGIAQGLHWLHVRGIVHGDVKPDNILIIGNPIRAELSDFSITSLNNDPYFTALGSNKWRCPESYRNDFHYTTSADIWGFGQCVLRSIIGFSEEEKPIAELIDQAVHKWQDESIRDILVHSLAVQPDLRRLGWVDISVKTDHNWVHCQTRSLLSNELRKFLWKGQLLDPTIESEIATLGLFS